MVGHKYKPFHPLGTVAFILKPVFLLLKSDLMQMYLETEKVISLCVSLFRSHKIPPDSVQHASKYAVLARTLLFLLSQPATGNIKEMDITSSAQ